MSKERLTVAVCARMGDPLFQAARARLIWAAQTAQATSDLGLKTLLVGSGNRLPIKVEGPEGVKALKRLVSDFYNIAADFDIMPLYPASDTSKDGHIEAEILFPKYVQPYVDIVQTRDPRVLQRCVKARIPVIYEDHNEDYHVAADADEIGLNSPMTRAIVAITTSVADRLVMMGVNKTKIIVMDSGVNARGFKRSIERAEKWRKSLLQGSRCDKLAVYTGGMQIERGISHILNTALHMPDVMFAMAGGNNQDNTFWLQEARTMNLTNVRFLSYLPQDQVMELQQAADVVLMTREAGSRTAITSPLKFFEYLAAGTPVLSAETPVLREKSTDHLIVSWYNPENFPEMAPKIQKVFADYPRRPDGYSQNMNYARGYTWQERQRKILNFAGLTPSHSEESA